MNVRWSTAVNTRTPPACIAEAVEQSPHVNTPNRVVHLAAPTFGASGRGWDVIATGRVKVQAERSRVMAALLAIRAGHRIRLVDRNEHPGTGADGIQKRDLFVVRDCAPIGIEDPREP